MDSFEDVMREFYDGEVGGEAIYSALLSSARTDDERFKFGTLLQLETETKAWLRAPMIARGLSIEESATIREKNIALIQPILTWSWEKQVQSIFDALSKRFVPRYTSHLDSVRSRGDAAEVAICLHMVEHEQAQLEFSRRELSGSSADSLEPVIKHLKYPLLR